MEEVLIAGMKLMGSSLRDIIESHMEQEVPAFVRVVNGQTERAWMDLKGPGT